jgi:lipopolysaccharide/colanic/teichoic acid biosynthesis glycosyltransferase
MVISNQKPDKQSAAAVEERPGSAEKIEESKDNLIFADEPEYWQSGFTPSRQNFFYYAIKRGIDIFYALVFLFVGIPWLVVCGLLMKREAPGPFFYSQDRIGKDGKVITVYKLRSMPVDAECNGPQLTPIEGDERLGPVGKFIRKAKIDELPQFWNVLIGEFSVIGPRAERPFFVEKFSDEFPLYNLRHIVKPGLTGLAQLNEKDSLNMRSKLRYDLFYVQKHNFLLDQKILWDTSMYCFRQLFGGFKEAGK